MAQLQVILLERVENLGQMGDVVKVKLGYARNFLLPHKKALRATKDNVSYFESRRAHLEADNLKRKSEAEAVAGKMDKARVSVVRQAGESGQLYGSVVARDISEGLTATGYKVERSTNGDAFVEVGRVGAGARWPYRSASIWPWSSACRSSGVRPGVTLVSSPSTRCR